MSVLRPRQGDWSLGSLRRGLDGLVGLGEHVELARRS